MIKTKFKAFTFKNIKDFIKLKIQKFTLSSLNAKFSNVNIIHIFIIKIIIKTHFINYSKVFNFNNNIKIIYKNISKSVCIMLLNKIIHNLMHSEYLLMSKKTVNKSVYTQFIINKNNTSFFYIKHTSTLKKLIMTFFNVIKLNFTFYKLKNKFKNFSSSSFHSDKTLNSMNFFVINKNSIIKKLKKLKSLINEKHKIVFFIIDKNSALKKLKKLKLFQYLDKSKEIIIINSNNIKIENK